jgi:hypothetical protein
VQAGGTGATPLLTADRVGQVRPETFELAQWRSPLAPAPLQLARADGECSAERRAEAPFVLGSPWREGDAQAAAVRCAATPSALLLAQLQSWAPATQDAAPARAVRIANSTGADIDLAKDGYVLEVYGDGARAPTHVIPLRGELASGASLSVASSGVPEEARRSAAVVDDQLAQRALDAVVLRRLATAAGGMCRAEVYAAASTVGAPPIVIASQPDPLPEGEPRTDESPIDPDRGGDLASPN